MNLVMVVLTVLGLLLTATQIVIALRKK